MTTLPEEAVKAMPERIYAKVHGASTDVISGQRGLIGGWNEHQRDGQAEYVRVDLYAALEAQLAEARQVVALFEDYGCPICHGDCSSANPPVDCCPMEAARRVREGGDRHAE